MSKPLPTPESNNVAEIVAGAVTPREAKKRFNKAKHIQEWIESLSDEALEAWTWTQLLNSYGRRKGVGRLSPMVSAMIALWERAQHDNVALKMIMDRQEGAPSQKVDLTSNGETLLGLATLTDDELDRRIATAEARKTT